jgi:hypothetical protein
MEILYARKNNFNFLLEEWKDFPFKEKLIPLKCCYCNDIFYVSRFNIKNFIYYNRKIVGCPLKCSAKISILTRGRKIIEPIDCRNCGINFIPSKNLHKNNKSTNRFCSCSCSVTYNNKHKTKGTRRSKLEIYLEDKLIELYPNLEIYFNRKDAINSELDIYIPSLNLAFELNGIFHYEPIFGKDKLKSIINNDNRKYQACIENQIELCIIDTSKLNYWKENNAIPYLDIIVNIINFKLLNNL